MLRTGSLLDLLSDALRDGFNRIGQVQIRQKEAGFSLRHIDDERREDLTRFSHVSDANEIVRYRDDGAYRPLKSAPDLRHGWCLDLPSLVELRLALDSFYPAALGNWRSQLREELVPVSMRTTVNRQTGMYRITGKITDEQGQELVGKFCRPGCMRSILWAIQEAGKAPEVRPLENHIPLLCSEPCNLFVAAARNLVKGLPLAQQE